MFCPHSAFICFAWIWKQTVIISPYCINWLVFITETECVCCVVRTGPLDIIETIGYYTYHQVYSPILRSAHTVYLCVLCGSENKQRSFPYTALTDRFLRFLLLRDVINVLELPVNTLWRVQHSKKTVEQATDWLFWNVLNYHSALHNISEERSLNYNTAESSNHAWSVFNNRLCSLIGTNWIFIYN